MDPSGDLRHLKDMTWASPVGAGSSNGGDPEPPTGGQGPAESRRQRTGVFDEHSFNGGTRPAFSCETEGAQVTWGGIPLWKRVLDLTCILLSLPLWLGVMICIALWVQLVSPGPVFFWQERVGFRGRRFRMLKFRSMKVNAEAPMHESHFDRIVQADCPMTKLDAMGDPRIIPGGRTLRAAGLDELPQIFNVLRGEMSLVGPRPCTPGELHRLQGWREERFEAAPGLTGWWQVNGKNRTTFSKMIELDVFYARHMSLRLDLAIMLRTFAALRAQVLESRSGNGSCVETAMGGASRR